MLLSLYPIIRSIKFLSHHGTIIWITYLGLLILSIALLYQIMYQDIFLSSKILLQGFAKSEELTKKIKGYLERELGEHTLIESNFWTICEGEDIAELVIKANDLNLKSEEWIRNRVNRRMNMQNFSQVYIDIIA